MNLPILIRILKIFLCISLYVISIPIFCVGVLWFLFYAGIGSHLVFYAIHGRWMNMYESFNSDDRLAVIFKFICSFYVTCLLPERSDNEEK